MYYTVRLFLKGLETMPKRIAITCYLYPDQDGELIAWLKVQQNRSAAIRRVLVEHLARLDSDDTVSDNVTPFTLADFRQVFDASLSAALSGLSLSPSAHQDDGDEVDECEALLDELGSNVVM